MKNIGNLFSRMNIALVLLILLFSPGLSSSASLPQKPHKRILVLYSLDRMLPAHEMMENGLLSIVKSDPAFDIELYPEYMDSSRFQGPEYLENLARFLCDKYSRLKPDIVITAFPNALSFFLDESCPVFPGVPIVACSIDEKTARKLEQTPEKTRITGVIIKEGVVDIIPMARALRPEIRRIALVGGSSAADKDSLTLIRNSLMQSEPEMDVLDLTELSMPRIIERVGTLPSDSIVLYSSIFIDGQGQHFTSRQALRMISRASNVPVFSPYESHFGYGIVGGKLLSFEAQGRNAAELAIRILAGELPGDIPFYEQDTIVSLFDWRELKRWNIPESAVPPGSEIRYRVLSSWEEHWVTIIGTIALIAIETFLILGLVMNLRKRRLVEKSLIESEMRLSLAAASANAGMWSLSPSTGQIWTTDNLLKLFDIHPNEKFNFERFLGRIHPEDRERVNQTIRQGMQSGEEIVIDYRVLLADGNVRWIGSRGRLQLTTTGNASRMMGVSVDITERKHSENELREAYLEIRKLKDRLEAESAYLQEEIRMEHNFENIVGSSDALKYVLFRVEQVASTDSNVLILGETGTGKELIARAIHSTGKRRGNTLIKVNCATLPVNLIESELFGHEKGAFTGADSLKLGRFELSSSGDPVSGRDRRASLGSTKQVAACYRGWRIRAPGQFKDNQS